MNVTKTRFLLIASFVLIAVSSTVAFSSTSAASSIAEFLFAGFSSSGSQTKASSENGRLSETSKLAPDVAVSETATARAGHTATRLDDNRVLIVGGDDGGTAEIYDAKSETLVSTHSLSAARSGHSAVKLADGRVLIAGGISSGETVATTEIYDPAAGTFAPGAMMNSARSGQTATVLANGKILIAGGDEGGTAEIYDAATGAFTFFSARMNASRARHSTVLMNDGRVFLAGGTNADGEGLNSAEIFNPETGEFTPIGDAMALHRTKPVLRVLPDGKVQIIGGSDDGSMEMFTPDGNYFSAYAHVIPGRDAKKSSAFKKRGAESKVYNAAEETKASEAESDVMKTATGAALINTGEAADSLLNRTDYALVEIPGANKILVTGGKNNGGEALKTSMAFATSGATITTDKLDYQPGDRVTITGAGFEPGETVQLKLVRDPVFPNNPNGITLSSAADAEGKFVNTDYLVTQDDLDTSFVLTAIGQTSGRTAQTTFTDSVNPINITSPVAASPATVTSLPATIPITFTYSTSATGTTLAFVAVKDSSGNTIVASPTQTITTTTTTTSATINVTIPAGTANANNYRAYAEVSNTVTPGTTTRQDTKNSAITVNVPVPTKLAFITSAFTAVAGQCGNPASLPITVQLQNAAGNKAQSTTNTTVNLTSSSAGGTFYSDAQCTRAITNVVISNAGNSAGFYYKDTTAGTPTITATASGLTLTTQIETILSNFQTCVSPSFSSPTNFNVGVQAGSVATGDFNNDGNVDIAAGTFSANYVSVMLGDGAGNLGSASTFTVGSAPGRLAVGDFNLDGKTDIVTANQNSGNISILLGTGSGSFSVATNFIVGGVPSAIAVADFNNDGKPDVVVTNNSGNSVSVFLGNGSGGLSGATTYSTVSGNPTGVVTGDFNSDGNTDFLVSNRNSSNIIIFSGNGTGSFPTSVTLTMPNYSQGSVVGDLNNDGNPDFAIVNDFTKRVYVRLGTGGGNFAATTSYNIGTASGLGLSDFNGDGSLDIATNDSTTTGSISLLLNNGSGVFGTATNFSVGTFPGRLAIADFNGDGKPDITVPLNPNHVSILLNSCTSAPDLTITKTHTGNFTVGTNGSYTLTVNNAANAAATSGAITVTDTLPTGLSFVSGTGTSWSCSATGQNVSCTNSNSLAAGASSSAITLTVGVGSTTPVGTNSITNTASVSTTGETINNNNSASDQTTVNQGSQTITFGTLADKIYGDADFTVSATASSGSPVNFVASGSCNISPTLANVVQISGAGNCTITAKQAGNSTYSAAPDVSQSFTISKAVLTVTAQDASREYGDANPTFAVQYSGFAGGETLATSGVTGIPNCATTATATSSAAGSPYAISCTVGTLASGNYSFSFVNGNLTITKANLTVTADNQSRGYGDENPTFTFQFAGFKNSETSAVLTAQPSCTNAATAASAASPPTYPITCSGGSAANYNFSYNPGALTVSKAVLTVTANDKSRAYGAVNPAFDAAITGFKNGETLASSGVTGSPACSATADASSSAAGSPYPITCAAGTLAAGNYTFSFIAGNLTVTKANLTATAQDASRGYGDENPTFAVLFGGFANGETFATSGITGTPNCTTTATPASPAGATTYPISCTAGTLAASNYDFSFVSGNLTVTKANLTVNAANQSREYGDANPTFAPQYAGFKNSETATVLTTAPTCSSAATATSPVSPPNYDIVCSGGASSNYNFNYVNGALTVTKAALSVTAADKTREYGDANPTFDGSINGIKNGDNITVTYATTATPTSAVGGYSIVPTLIDPNSKLGNYTVTSNNGTLTVSAAIATVKANDKSRAYGAANPAFDVMISGLKNGETNAVITTAPNCATTATATSTAGNYPITCSGAAAANYTFNYVAGQLSVTKANLNVTADNKSRGYGAANPSFTYTITGYANSENATTANVIGEPILSTTATATSAVGSYEITVANGNLSATNYNFTPVNGTLEITKAVLTVSADGKSKTYGDANPALTFSLSGFAGADNAESAGVSGNPVLSTTADATSAVGSYPIKVDSVGTLTAANYNFAASATNGVLAVGKATPTFMVQGGTHTYDGNPHPASGSVMGIGNTVIGAPTFEYTPGGSSAPVNAGTYSAIGSFAGNANYNSATSDAVQIVVNKAGQNITFGTLTGKTFGDADFVVSATASSNLAVSFAAGGNCSVLVDVVHITGAGSCTITASQAGNDNYTAAAPVPQSFNIAKAAATIALSNLSYTFDGSPKSATATTNPVGLNSVSITYNGSTTAPTDAGSYAVIASLTNDNYEASNATGTLVISKASATVALGNLLHTYDGATKAATAATTPSGLTINFAYSQGGNPATPANAGSYNVLGTVNDANYEGSANGVLVINKAAATIALSNLSHIYDNTPKSVTATTNPVGLTGVSITYEGSATTPTNAGSYTVVATLTNDNYAAENATGTLVIGKAAASITLSGLSHTYDGTAKSAATTTNPAGLSGVSVTYNNSPTAPTNAGSYAVIASLTNDNYEATNATDTLVIQKAAATVTLSNLNQTYDGSGKSATATTVPAGLNVSFTYDGSPTAPINAGSYAVAATIDDTNYQGAANNTLVIGKATPTVSFTSIAPASLVYQGTYNPTATNSSGGAAVLGASGACSISGVVVTMNSGIGVCTVTATAAETANYFGAAATPQTINAAKAGQTIVFTGAPANATFGTSFPVSASATSNLPVSVTATAGICSIDGGGLVTMTSGTGVCNLTATQAGDDNYSPAENALQTTNAQKAAASISLNGLTQTYDGTARIVTASTTPNGLSGVSITYAGSATAPINAGSYAIVASLSHNDYQATNATGTLIVGKAPQTISWSNPAPISYGTALSNTQLNASVAGITGGSAPGALTYNPVSGTVLGAGSRTLNVTAAATDNYLEATANVTLQVNTIALTVTAEGKTKTYGAALPTFTVSYSGFANGDTPGSLGGTLAFVTSATPSSNVGDYAITPSGLTSDNYTINFANGNLSVTPAPLTVKANDQTKLYGAALPTFTTTFNGFVLGQNAMALGGTLGFNTTPTVTATSPVGTYTITPSGYTSSNYQITFQNGTLTVNPDPTSITLDNRLFGANFDCIYNQYTATLKDTITGAGLSGIKLKLTIGTQTATATTANGGVATFTLILNQTPGNVTESVGLDQVWADTNRVAPQIVSRSFAINANTNVGPGRDATSLYSGSPWFWTTSSTSSTATLTLSATIMNTGECNGDITKAKVSFLISTNGGTSWSPISSAQNLPVGLVNPNDPNTGTASAISQYNIGSNQFVTLSVRVVVGGHYNSNTTQYDQIISIGKPGQANSLMGGGKLVNDNIPFPANGFLGANSIGSSFGANVTYTRSGTNPKGDVTVTITSCNKADGSVEPGCTIGTPAKWHTYFIKSNSISELSLINGSASFGSKTNVSEILPNGSKVSLDGGNTMQLVFTPYNMPYPTGMSAVSGKCLNLAGCASIVSFKSNGGVWYSSAWGQPSGTSALKTYLKNVASGLITVQQ